ncbi:MAG TPA: ATP-binding cassette domain-containing protein, partial [Gammaproteobacteria bacterium]|nr:ATP-binding cassette domain-containing protein [Gammaproteobacteria bacterium]
MTHPAVVLSDLSKCFHSGGRVLAALTDVSFSIQPGRVTGLIGPDGAGKTTLMRLAAGLFIADQGNIEVLGIDVQRDPLRVQSRVGYMPQRFGLYEDLSVQENLDLYADLQNVPRQQRAARYKELMQMTGLAPFTQRLAGRLSGGMKQKLGLACTLVRSPRLLLLDEPTVGVDPVSRRELWQIVYQQVQDAGMTVLLSTAYLDEAERCDEVILLHEGRMLGQGRPQSFSDEVAGRVFQISAENMTARRLQAQLDHAPGVLDALIEGESVRLVMQEEAIAEANVLLPGESGIKITPALPRFEDAFVARLKTRSEQDKQTLSLQIKISDGDDEVIQIKNLSRRFGDFVAVNNLSFSVRRGEIFGLLGA